MVGNTNFKHLLLNCHLKYGIQLLGCCFENAIHTHAGFPILWGFSIDNNDFYTVQTVSPNPTPKQQPSQKTLCKKKQKHLV